jgi:tRNA uridine 5-carboxymethylaminomethyl modification enzyme
MPVGRRLGLVRETAFHVERERWRRRRRTGAELAAARLNPDVATRRLVRDTAGIDFSAPTTWARILRRHDVDLRRVAATLPLLHELSEEDWRIVVGHLRYDGYLARHERERERLRRLRHVPIPADLDPAVVSGLTREAAEALARERPRTLADAERLPGITPATLAVLAGHIARRRDAK